jgi:hypothetical protein
MLLVKHAPCSKIACQNFVEDCIATEHVDYVRILSVG